MKPHKALIVDDERIARRELSYLLQQHPEIEIVAEAASIEEACDAISRLHPELIFLDVQLPGATGFELFERTIVEAHVIFVTAFDEFALRAFEVNALDYLTKPVAPQRLRRAIERYLHKIHDEVPQAVGLNIADSILLTIDRVPRFIKLAAIECLLAEGDYTHVICHGRSVGMVAKSLKDWEKVLPEKQFCRIQRATIINCEHVLRFEPGANSTYQVYMREFATPLTMSRRCARAFRTRFHI